MSFARAKIRRFNDVKSDTPAPGAYNPVINYKIKGYATLTAKRFPDDNKVSKTGPSNLKVKQISRRDPKTTVKSTIITKNLQYHRAHEAVINNRAAKDPVLLEYEIENLKQKVFRIIPGLKSEMKELREIWHEKKLAIFSGDKEKEKVINDNLNNVLKEITQHLKESQHERMQEIGLILAMSV